MINLSGSISCLFIATGLFLGISQASVAKPKPKKLVKVWESDSTLLRTPESVLFDAASEIVYVANIDGKADELDGNGFISQMTTDGKVTNLRWATGLNAPKGMGLFKGKLYVTDVYRLVEINTATGQVEKTYDAIDPKNAFLNDVTVTNDGIVYVSDSRFDKIYRLKDGNWEVVMSGEQLNKPNGLLAEGKNSLLIGSTKIGALRRVDLATQKITTIAEGMTVTDGIVSDGKAGFFVSDWNGQVFFVDKLGEKQSLLDTRASKINSADIEYIKRGKLLLVPTFFKNTVVAYRVE
ncbi:SMP-30/gluconolactonase/LRE family protein [Fibrella forsythiae]|uniref:SMP-30/gluconolactonase/LRE family protein n=1 Tax=Fibrella forsythiae TaxID=2817061 RepID=A0ABS3JN26_9BACT|nr:SMP-30/gluconolactonase/LRE family protein [Fibrella forsythiae]MBO0951402.1 SMP-30/gluconolactonase/LRE family protein [Fibrella forsythiae]